MSPYIWMTSMHLATIFCTFCALICCTIFYVKAIWRKKCIFGVKTFWPKNGVKGILGYKIAPVFSTKIKIMSTYFKLHSKLLLIMGPRLPLRMSGIRCWFSRNHFWRLPVGWLSSLAHFLSHDWTFPSNNLTWRKRSNKYKNATKLRSYRMLSIKNHDWKG